MRIRLETGGGFTGLTRVAEFDTDEAVEPITAQPDGLAPGTADVTGAALPAARLAVALAALDSVPGPAGPPDPGPAPRYRLTVFGATGARVYELAEPAIPPDLRPLISLLLTRAQVVDASSESFTGGTGGRRSGRRGA